MRWLFRCAAIGLSVTPATIAFAQQVQADLRVTVSNVEDRTTTIVARMTPVQRQHARLHQSRQPAWRSKDKLLDRLLSVDQIIDYGWLDPTKVRSARSVVTNLICGSDAVFVARTVALEGLPTEDGTMLFTDYQLQASEVMRTRTKMTQLTAGRTVIGTRPGGKMRVEGVEVIYSLKSYPPLEVGRHYLIMADVIPRTGTFDLLEPQGVLELRDDLARAPWVGPTVEFGLTDPGVALSELREWIASARCR